MVGEANEDETARRHFEERAVHFDAISAAVAQLIRACYEAGAPLRGLTLPRADIARVWGGWCLTHCDTWWDGKAPDHIRGVPVTLIDPPKCPTCGQEKP